MQVHALLLLSGAVAAGAVAASAAAAQDPTREPAAGFAAPVRLQAAGEVIDTPNIGHAAPFVGDFDGDGTRDLLVGQFDGGLLWIYRNLGSDAEPRLAAGVKFQDGRKEGTVPTG
jgi:hypothetical protein